MYPLIVFDVKNTEIVLNGLIISHILIYITKNNNVILSKSPVVCYLHNLNFKQNSKLTDNAIFYFFVFWCGRPFFSPYGGGKSYYEVSY